MRKSTIILGAELYNHGEASFLNKLYSNLPELGIHHLALENAQNLPQHSASWLFSSWEWQSR